jgi:hypothetical protein
MSKKHSKMLAECLRLYAKPYMSELAYNELVCRMAFDFAVRANTSFDYTKFKEACFK